MKLKTLLVAACAAIFFLAFSTFSHAQTCCKVPDSLKVVSVTDTSFKVSWYVPDSASCDSIIGGTIEWRKAGSTTWLSKTETYTAGHKITFTDTASDCTQYQWQVRNECKHGDSTYYSAYVGGTNFSTYCKATCCHEPDSLKVVSVTDTSFCVSWVVRDSLPCDSIAHGTIQYRVLNTIPWTTVAVTYSGRRGTINFCDTGSTCARYQWQVSNVCTYKDTTVNSVYVSGPTIFMLCPPKTFAVTAPAIHVYPNPTQSSITLSGTFESEDNSIVTITDVYGAKRLERSISGTGKSLNTNFNIATLPNGLYFITVIHGKAISKTTFLKGQ